MDEMERSGPSLWVTFIRSQAASIIATFIDFGIFLLCLHIFSIWYVASTAIGGFAGAVTHFLLGRHWSFEAADGELHAQSFRYALVAVASLGVNAAGVYGLTDGLGVPATASKLILSFLTGVFFNFPLHRWYVFS